METSASKAVMLFFIFLAFQTLLYFALTAGMKVYSGGNDVSNLKNVETPDSVSATGFFKTANFILKFIFVEFYGLPLAFALAIFALKLAFVIFVIAIISGAS